MKPQYKTYVNLKEAIAEIKAEGDTLSIKCMSFEAFKDKTLVKIGRDKDSIRELGDANIDDICANVRAFLLTGKLTER